jgi:hypothetical protein
LSSTASSLRSRAASERASRVARRVSRMELSPDGVHITEPMRSSWAAAVVAAKTSAAASGSPSKAAIAGAGAHLCLTCLTEKLAAEGDGALLAHGPGWMSPYQGDAKFWYGVLDRREVPLGLRFRALR